MVDIKQGRWTAEIEGDFVVFIIGARINSKWQAFRTFADLGGRRGMNHMLKYLTEHPEKGLLGYETMGFAERPVLALVRTPRGVRQGHRRPAPRRLAQLLEARRQGHAYGDLARDLPRARRRVRGDLRQHAGAWARQGQPPGAGRRIGRSAPTTEGRGSRLVLM